MPEVYDVQVPALRESARQLADDATAAAAARDAGSRAATDAAGSVDGGPLAEASHGLAVAIGAAGSALSTAMAGAGTTLTSNADRYDGDDASASQQLQAVTFDTGSW